MADPTIDEIKQRIDIVDLISGTVALKKAGRSYKGLCPFHQEKTPSFNVDPDRGTYHCFGCSKSGDVFSWVQETEGLDFGEALRKLADRAGVRLPERQAPRPDPQAQAAADALSEASAWFHNLLLRAPEGAQAREYLGRRGVRLATVERFALGWAPERWDGLTVHLKRRGLTEEQIESAGLALKNERGLHDRFRARVIFPIRDAGGKVTGFGGRTLGDGQPKYLNSPQTATFDKSATLYALDLARGGIRKSGQAVIVEGYMDALMPHQAGFDNVVASLGTALTERQIELLRRYTQTIVLALDADAAGQAATLRGLEVARQALGARSRPVPGRATRTGYLQLSAGQIKIAVLAGGKDPDEIVRDDPQAWQRLIDSAVPMMEHKLELELGRVDPTDAQAKRGAVQELARFLVQVPDPIAWGHYIDLIAQRLRLDLREVRDEVQRAAREGQEEERRQAQRERARQQTPDVAGPAERPGIAPSSAGAPAVRETRPAPALARLPAARTAAPGAPGGAGDVSEEHLVAILVLAPHLLRRMPVRLTPEDFRSTECRELFRALLSYVEGDQGQAHGGRRGDESGIGRGQGGPGGGGEDDDPIGSRLDASLRGYYDRVRTQGRKEPYHTEAQLEAAVAGVV
ncbi:MAG TPA: DNA primase, partial [Chloroflexota bacterium]|nr:DNA primase [Chloroflexota bacterium]